MTSILLERGARPRELVPVCSDREELLTWSAVWAWGRRVVAVLLLRWGLWNTSTVSYGMGMRCEVVRVGEMGVGLESRLEVSLTYPTVETVGLRRGLIAVARLGRRGVAVVIRLRRTGTQGNAVVSGEFVKERAMSGWTRGRKTQVSQRLNGSHTGSSPGRRGRLLAGARRHTRFGSRDSQT